MKIFVYGTLKRGKSNHDLMYGYDDVEEGYVNGYKMYTNGYYPLAVRGDENDIIFGEIFSFNKNQENILKKLDMLEGYNNEETDLYKRIEVNVNTESGTEQAYMYLYNRQVINKELLLIF